MKLPHQKGMVIWLMGLSGAGKSTISNLFEEQLNESGFFSMQLDGDEMRKGLNYNLGFSMDDRAENIRRAAETAKIIASNGVIVTCSFITPLNAHREMAKNILGDLYFEVFIDCPIDVCEQRDVKGLYEQAHNNTLKNFTGVSSAFERPTDPDLILYTANSTVQQCCNELHDAVKNRITDHA
ncbi:adenylyl-sulfate kinase [Pedobacter foliorum]|uniref:adenylyl-sulfate kinase n=1 Tax=Pedobacter foliorum TaxID=2739058 RepID=UPI0015673A03|nr:adenylyl-sulfate kinase [Pedobacter foliorum]NRF37318.1 adenylyl-sulfate kinase [Pedobacter foliorum]